MAIDLDDIKEICKREINRAGARYTPQIEDRALNLRVKRVLNDMDKIKDSGKMLEICMKDHIILTAEKSLSFKVINLR